MAGHSTRGGGKGKAEAGFGLGAGDLDALQKLGFGHLQDAGAAWAETVAEIGSEAASFVAARIREDLKTQQEILGCKTLTDLQEVQTRFLERAIDQYQTETGKMVELSQAFFTLRGRDGTD